MTRKTNRVKGREYNYYYCPTGKKNGCDHPVMMRESTLTEYVRSTLQAHIANVAALDAVLSGVDQMKINQQLADSYAAQVSENEKQLAATLEFKARLLNEVNSSRVITPCTILS